MYEEYFGFVEKPFSLTPDPKYLYKSESHANAFELLQYAIRRREGFIVITGDIGTGKTTLCRALLEQIDRRTFTALVLNPFLSEEDLLKLILQDFGIVSRDEVKKGRLNGITKQQLIDTVYDFLLGLLPLHANAVLIIDEAQNLPFKTLEQIRILSNLETDKEKLLQIVLVGQLNLQQVLRSPELRQLDQRVSIRYEVKPLSREEGSAYVAHRLTIAGGSTAVSFRPRALDHVHRLSGGIPRLINLICDRALLGAFSARTNRVTPEIVMKAAESLELRVPSALRLNWVGLASSVALVGLCATALSVVAAGGIPGTSYTWSGGSFTSGASGGSGSSQAARVASLPPGGRPSPPPVRSSAAEPPAGSASQRAGEVVDASGPDEGATQAATSTFESGAADRHQIPDGYPYAVLVGSFPLRGSEGSLSARSAAGVQMVTEQLESLGYAVYHGEVDLGPRGRWRRVMVGAYADEDAARRDEGRLRQMREFNDARMITVAPSLQSRVPRSAQGSGE